uniref:Dachsous cadherin-related 2 n=1 Tax=Seriola lalandi dorsalis TaxID=1841481 RepID=A0A3B4YM88_SERLL
MREGGMGRKNAAAWLLQTLVLWLLCAPSRGQVFNLTLSVKEGLPAKTIVGDLGAGLRKPSTGFFISESRDSYVFRDLEIDADTGIISTAVILDRESRDKASDNGAQPEYSSTFVGVKVLNINDNSPTISILFLSETGDAVVSEAAAVGDYVARISGGDGKFNLKQTDDFLYALCVNAELDRENKDLYELKVQASDFGSPPLSSETVFLLKVADTNDCQPVFEKDVYVISISEDAPQGSSLIQMQARDADEGVNSDVRYSVLKSSPDGLISIDPESGLVTTAASLDREAQMEVWFLVVATDGGEPALSSTATVTVLVEDVNDNEPVFQQQLYNVSIPEHRTVLFIAHAHDYDSGANGRVSYYLRSSRNGTFAIDPNLGTVTLNRSLQVDRQQRYSLEVVAKDEGELSLSSVLTLTVNVDRTAAEDSLAFETLVYQVEIGEGYRKDSRVIQVRAHRTRGAHMLNSGLTYSLEAEAGFPPAPFRVHPKTGWLYLSQNLDYETESVYRFRVSATSREASLANATVTATVIVLVLDVNDNAPVFSSEVYYFTVSEGASPQGLVGTVRAVDKDSGKNAQLSYILLSDGKFFRINAKTGKNIHVSDFILMSSCALLCSFAPYSVFSAPIQGKSSTGWHWTGSSTIRVTLVSTPPPAFRSWSRTSMTTLRSLHTCLRDTPRFHRLTVRAVDHGLPSLSSTQTLTVEVGDVNDQPPVFTQSIYNASVAENRDPGEPVVRVSATDKDSGNNHQLFSSSFEFFCEYF